MRIRNAIFLIFVIFIVGIPGLAVTARAAQQRDDQLPSDLEIPQFKRSSDRKVMFTIIYKALGGSAGVHDGDEISAGRDFYLWGFSLSQRTLNVTITVYESYRVEKTANGTEQISYQIMERKSFQIVVVDEFVKRFIMPEIREYRYVNVSVDDVSFFFKYRTDWSMVSTTKTNLDWLVEFVLYLVVALIISVGLAYASGKAFIRRVVAVPRTSPAAILWAIVAFGLVIIMLVFMGIARANTLEVLAVFYIGAYLISFWTLINYFSLRDFILGIEVLRHTYDEVKPYDMSFLFIYRYKDKWYEIDLYSWKLTLLRLFGKRVPFSVPEKFWQGAGGQELIQKIIETDVVVQSGNINIRTKALDSLNEKVVFITGILLVFLLWVVGMFVTPISFFFLLVALIVFGVWYLDVEISPAVIEPLPKTATEWRRLALKESKTVILAGKKVEALIEENEDLKLKLQFGVHEEASVKAMTHTMMLIEHFFQDKAEEQLPGIIEGLLAVRKDRERKKREIEKLEGEIDDVIQTGSEDQITSASNS